MSEPTTENRRLRAGDIVPIGEPAELQWELHTLPNFASTEEAVRYGEHIKPDQYLFIAGARAALQREFSKTSPYEAGGNEKRNELAYEIQLLGECLDAAPDLVLASLILNAGTTRTLRPGRYAGEFGDAESHTPGDGREVSHRSMDPTSPELSGPGQARDQRDELSRAAGCGGRANPEHERGRCSSVSPASANSFHSEGEYFEHEQVEVASPS